MPDTITPNTTPLPSDTAGSERLPMQLPSEVEIFNGERAEMAEHIGSRLLLQEVFHDSRASELVAQFNDCLPAKQHVYLAEYGTLQCIHCGKGFSS